ncbi:histidine kinase dimerization/phospho-acceptor domain-containing protein [Variovorax sp. RCC_210]|jgi:signal transduction histidine kinase|uniref:histidine kinase dimerization/phospho-acceptor domain-containing protein n=1 Tax=Variovorax sp. RCC_210 TaxID=3239217 RepID=UPI000D5F4ED3
MKKIKGGQRTPARLAAVAGVLAGIAGITGGWVGARLLREPTPVPSSGQRYEDLRARFARRALEVRQLDHDLRAPLGAMALAMELLRTTEDAELRREATDVLARQIERMNSLTQRLHDFSRRFNN